MSAAKEARRNAHRERMAERRERQLARTVGLTVMRKGRAVEIKTRPKPILANVSRHHPDAGLTPLGHAVVKAGRNRA
jgi:hypothetical protein